MEGFAFAKTPKILFGSGKFQQSARLIRSFGTRALLVTGKSSFEQEGRWEWLTGALKDLSVDYFSCRVSGEPSPKLVDSIVEKYRGEKIEVVFAWGGGSVMDAGKAISAMLPLGETVTDYLEGVGAQLPHPGDKIPLIAVPTTAGTGSETTKNAVLSKVGPGGFKKSLRHENFVPDIALVDPKLTLSCPQHITAPCGMDALTQLLESYVSTNASPMTDGLAKTGLTHIGKGLIPSVEEGEENLEARSAMSMAAMLSGITLANAGLGVIHGLASTIGGRFDIPHGVVCGTLMAAAVRATIRELQQNDKENIALEKFSRAGYLLTGMKAQNNYLGCELLIESIQDLTNRFRLPKLSTYGVEEKDLAEIAQATSNKYNPAQLSPEMIVSLLEERL